MYSEATWLRKPGWWESRSGTLGENSRSSKSSVLALMLWRNVMFAGRIIYILLLLLFLTRYCCTSGVAIQSEKGRQALRIKD